MSLVAGHNESWLLGSRPWSGGAGTANGPLHTPDLGSSPGNWFGDEELLTGQGNGVDTSIT